MVHMVRQTTVSRMRQVTGREKTGASSWPHRVRPTNQQNEAAIAPSAEQVAIRGRELAADRAHEHDGVQVHMRVEQGHGQGEGERVPQAFARLGARVQGAAAKGRT